MMTTLEQRTMEAVNSAAHRYIKNTESIDWDEVEIRAAIAAMQGLLSADAKFEYGIEQTISSAIYHADVLVKRLKAKKERDNE